MDFDSTSVRLGDVATIKHGWPFKSERFSEVLTGRPIVIAIGNFDYTGGFRFDSTSLKEYRGDYPKGYELTPGDILLVMTCQTPGGEILGIPARVPNDGRVYLHNQRIGKVVITRPDIVDADFLYWVFLWKEFNQELVASSTGTKILHTAPSRIEAFRFDLPSIETQRRIARLLWALEDKRQLNHKMIRTLGATANALFRSWFVDFDPVVAKAAGDEPAWLDPRTAALFSSSFVESGSTVLPADWLSMPLDRAAVFLNGLALQRYPANGGPALPVIKIAQLRAGSAQNAEQASTDVPAQFIVDDGDLIFSWSGSLLVELWTGGRGALNQHLFKVTSPNFPKWFCLHWIRHHLPDFQAIAADKATTMGHIRRHHLSEASVSVPPSELLHRMDALMAPILDLQIHNAVESRGLAVIRDLILPKLLSGEIRLGDAERAVEAVA